VRPWRSTASTSLPSILGILSTIAARAEPVFHPRLTFFVELIDGRGAADIVVRIVGPEGDLHEEPGIASMKTRASFPDPFSLVQLVFGFWDLLFPRAGDYRVILEVEGRYVIERKLTITVPE